MLGAADADIPIGEDGSPAWPSGIVGSITHSNGLAFAAVAWRSKAISLGIDVERIIPLSTAAQLVPLITSSDEYQRLRADPVDAEFLTTIVFSAKETIFKCIYPLVKRRFDFIDAEILSIDASAGTFSFALSPTISRLLPVKTPLVGKLAIIADLIHTGLLLPHGRRGRS